MAKTLDEKVTLGMFIEKMGDRVQKLLAGTLSDEEKLAAIIQAIEAEVQKQRVLVRQTSAEMKLYKDPSTQKKERIEAALEKIEKLKDLGARIIDDPVKEAQVGQIQHEIDALEKTLERDEKTHEILEDTLKIATANYKEAFSKLEEARTGAPAILKAIKARREALARKDKAKDVKAIDTSFLKQLDEEFDSVDAEFRSDDEIDKDIDATVHFNVDDELAKLDAESVKKTFADELRARAAAKKA